VSGKDSLNNEYLGADGERHAVPPTLVITAIAPVPGVATVTPDLKAVGDVLVLCGRTEPELGGSHLVEVLGGAAAGFRGDVPAPDPEAPARYRAVHAAIQRGLVRAAHDCSEGGLAVAVAEMVVGGRMGARLETTGHDDVVVGLFSESVGRLVLEVDPRHVDEVLATVPTARVVGVVTGGDMLELPGTSPLPLGSLVHAWSSLAGAGGPP
jgi:phosphoribosylformylglycinamidine synthase